MFNLFGASKCPHQGEIREDFDGEEWLVIQETRITKDEFYGLAVRMGDRFPCEILLAKLQLTEEEKAYNLRARLRKLDKIAREVSSG